jgi:hypothetical protein
MSLLMSVCSPVIIVSWSNVFTYLGRLTYEVSVGTTQGGADVIQWQETLNDYMEVSIPEKFKQQSNLNLFFLLLNRTETFEKWTDICITILD